MGKLNEFDYLSLTLDQIINETEVEINDIAFYHDSEQSKYFILHNFAHRFLSDDEFAYKISNILYKNLDENKILNYEFFEDQKTLNTLSASYKISPNPFNSKKLFSRNESDYSQLTVSGLGYEGVEKSEKLQLAI